MKTHKFINLNHLPKRGTLISWTETIGYDVYFEYADECGYLKITNYNVKSKKLTILYNDKLSEIKPCDLAKCSIGCLIGKYMRWHMYNIGDVVSGFKILNNQERFKGEKVYSVQCLKCGFIDNMRTETSLKNDSQCPVCTGRKVLKGVNDIATTHPHLVKYFADIGDAYKVSKGTHKRIKFKCDKCGKYKYYKMYEVAQSNKISCDCHGGKSYCEKFIFSILKQLNVDFKNEYTASWSKPKRYDFYIKQHRLIIETHGEQHYTKSFLEEKGRSLEEEQKNDEAKCKLALNNRIKHYIVLDCRKSDPEWIKNSVMNSELPDLLDFKEEDIDWLKCHEYCMDSKIKEICTVWESGVHSPKEISKNYQNMRMYSKKIFEVWE